VYDRAIVFAALLFFRVTVVFLLCTSRSQAYFCVHNKTKHIAFQALCPPLVHFKRHTNLLQLNNCVATAVVHDPAALLDQRV